MSEKKCQNIRQNRHRMLETSCEVRLQLKELIMYHPETVIKFVNCFEKEKTTTKFWQ